MFLVGGHAAEAPVAPTGFNPKDLDGLEMFLESVTGVAVATNTSAEAYRATGENTPLEMVWSDHERFPHGSVRWWLDQSDYQNDKKIRPSRTFKTGRDIGQDDHDRPGYIPDGCNGRPCIRGGLISSAKGEKHGVQPCYFELQLESRDFEIEGPYSVFLLIRPVEQERDSAIFGQFHRSVLSHDPDQACLEWKNSGKITALSSPGSLKVGEWSLVEVSRDSQNTLRCRVNGIDVTAGNPKDELPFVFMFLFNHNKGQGFAGQDPFAGDIAALLVYRTELMETERSQVRQYLGSIYGLEW